MNIDKKFAELYHIDDIDITVIKGEIDKIKPFQIYDEYMQSYIPDDQGIPGLKAFSKKQNVNAWSSKCNYLIAHIKKDFLSCIKTIEEDENLFLGYRISEKDQEKFYFIENVEYRLFTLCDVLAQMYNELFEVEKNIGKINHSFFFKKDFKSLILSKYNGDVADFVSQEINKIASYFDDNDDYKYVKEKRNSFTHRENPHDGVILNGGKNKFLVDHPLFELNRCVKVFMWIYLRICTIEKLLFFMLKNIGILTNYEVIGVEKIDEI